MSSEITPKVNVNIDLPWIGNQLFNMKSVEIGYTNICKKIVVLKLFCFVCYFVVKG